MMISSVVSLLEIISPKISITENGRKGVTCSWRGCIGTEARVSQFGSSEGLSDPRTLIQSIGSLRLWVVLDRSPGSARRAFVTMGSVYGR
jgi:hypothetical protein